MAAVHNMNFRNMKIVSFLAVRPCGLLYYQNQKLATKSRHHLQLLGGQALSHLHMQLKLVVKRNFGGQALSHNL